MGTRRSAKPPRAGSIPACASKLSSANWTGSDLLNRQSMFESSRERQHGHVAQWTELPGPNGRRAGSSPAVATMECRTGQGPARFAKPMVPARGCESFSPHSANSRAYLNGRVPALQADHRGSIPRARSMVPSSIGQDTGFSHRRGGIDTRRDSHLTRSVRRRARPLKPQSSVRHRGPLPATRCLRRGRGFHTAVRAGRHRPSGPCCRCSMAMSTPTVNRWDGVRFATAVPVCRVSSMVELRPPNPLTRVRFLHPMPIKSRPPGRLFCF